MWGFAHGEVMGVLVFTPKGWDNLAQGKTAKLSPPWVTYPTSNSTLKGCDTG